MSCRHKAGQLCEFQQPSNLLELGTSQTCWGAHLCCQDGLWLTAAESATVVVSREELEGGNLFSGIFSADFYSLS